MASLRLRAPTPRPAVRRQLVPARFPSQVIRQSRSRRKARTRAGHGA